MPMGIFSCRHEIFFDLESEDGDSQLEGRNNEENADYRGILFNYYRGILFDYYLHLVICDELGYVGFDKEGAEMLFNHLSLRTGKKATIITTNLPFTRWEEVLKDKVLCAALVDRLCHKSYLINMTGTSYRIKETKKLTKKI